MRKTLIIFWSIIVSGCSAERIGLERRDAGEKNDFYKILNLIEKNNITDENFFIKSGDVLLRTEKETKKFIFTIKHTNNNYYLISLKNSLGIEGARIYISEDTVLINDRINRRVLYGSKDGIKKLYGIPSIMVKLIFGDVVITNGKISDKLELIDKKLILSQYNEGMTGRSVISKKYNKIEKTEWNNGPGGKGIMLKYYRFGKENKHIPSKIEFFDQKSDINARIRIKKVQMNWDGEIEFIPGNGYKKEEIK